MNNEREDSFSQEEIEWYEVAAIPEVTTPLRCAEMLWSPVIEPDWPHRYRCRNLALKGDTKCLRHHDLDSLV